MQQFDHKGFGKRLRQAREKARLTMSEVYQHVYITQSVISRYESGEVTPTIERVFSLANLYGVSIDWLCGVEVNHR